MDNVSPVVEFLRKTSKGQLQYDVHGTVRTIKETVDEFIKRDNSLLFPQKTVIINRVPEENVKSKEKNNSDKTKNNQIKSECVELREEDFFNLAELEDKLKFAQYEAERQKTVEELKLLRKISWNTECQSYSEYAKQQFNAWNQQQTIARNQQQEKDSAYLANRKIKVLQTQTKMKETNEQRGKVLSAQIKILEMKEKQMEQQNLEKLEALQRQDELKKSLVECQRQINYKSKEIVDVLKKRNTSHHLSESIQQIIHKQRNVVEAINHMVAEKREKLVVENDLQTAQFLILQVDDNLQKLTAEIEKENSTASRASTIIVSPTVITPPVPTQTLVSNVVTENVAHIEQPSASQQVKIPEEAQGFEIYQYITPESLKEHLRIQNIASQYKEAYIGLASDISPRMKKYKFALQKAVNIPVNAISPLSGSHLRDKLVRLKTLLQGQAVDVGDNRRVSTNEHPQALAFCKDTLAKKFVRQGYELVSSNFEAAFAIATVIIGLWAEIPDFGDLFLAHIHKTCPYTLPFYVPKEENQSSEEHYKSLGYVYTDGVIEKQDKFLKRMSGLVRLYFSVICLPMPQIFNKPHPHGIENGWKWLARALNLEPRPDVTPTILFDFLETAGFAMQQAYGVQFTKLLSGLYHNYLPKIRQVTQSGCGGPLIRLENFLEKCVRQQKIPPPEGLITHDFWDNRKSFY